MSIFHTFMAILINYKKVAFFLFIQFLNIQMIKELFSQDISKEFFFFFFFFFILNFKAIYIRDGILLCLTEFYKATKN